LTSRGIDKKEEMKQKIIIYGVGLITGLGIWFAYDRIEAYNNTKSIENYFEEYEKNEFMVEEEEVPEFIASDLYEMKLISSDEIEVSIKKGKKIIFLNFWATWCKPCIEEMPSIQELYEKSKENIDFYLLTYEDIDKAMVFIENKGFTFPIYSYQNKTNLPNYFQFHGGSIPDTYIIYDDEIKFHHLGAAPWNSNKVDSLFTEILDKK
jgi:thiol-disulfide isomerase/thioredoxin